MLSFHRVFVLTVLVSLSACSSSSAPTDARVADALRADAIATDVLSDGGAGLDSGLPSSCSSACAQQNLKATFGTIVEGFERAVYGIETTAGGPATLYIEALQGGFSGCPEQNSPTPQRSLLITGLPLPTVGTWTKAEGIAVTLFDYQGTLLPNAPLTKASGATVTFSAANVCPSCVGQPAPAHAGGFVALELSATFDQGTASGHLYALHCDSLDL